MPRRGKPHNSYEYAKEMRTNPTDAELALWQAIRGHRLDGLHFRRQHPIGPYITDFCSITQKIVIELAGGEHLGQQAYDSWRTAYLEKLGYKVLRFWNDDVLMDLGAVLEAVLDGVRESQNEQPPH